MRRNDWESGDSRRLEPVNPAIAQDRAERLFELDRRGHLVWAMEWECPVLRCTTVGHGLTPGECVLHNLRLVAR